jgi:hypothetical protein
MLENIFEQTTKFTLTYGRLVITTSSLSMLIVLDKLGWKIRITELGELI